MKSVRNDSGSLPGEMLITYLKDISNPAEKIKAIYGYVDNKNSERPLALLETLLTEINEHSSHALKEVNRRTEPSKAVTMEELNCKLVRNWIKNSKYVIPQEPPKWLSKFITGEENYSKLGQSFQKYGKEISSSDRKVEEQKQEASKVMGLGVSNRVLVGAGYNSINTEAPKTRPSARNSHDRPRTTLVPNAGWDIRPVVRQTTNNQNK